ncbi:Uridylate kinase [uncultured archaeon]|nr:Uridylate kinase [uncultured archaeon]
MQSYVISLGGSLIAPDKIDAAFLAKFRDLIVKHSKNNRFIIICGGGKVARNYQAAAKSIVEPTKTDLDWLGIHATRLNAHLVRTILKPIAYVRVLKNPTEKVALKPKENVIVAAGWKPGSSTDYGAVLLARTFHIETVINLTDIDYVYTKDPKKFDDAKPIKQITWKAYREIMGNKWSPGANAPFDPVASREAQKDGITVHTINGRNLANLERLLEGKGFIGTTIA